MYCRVLDECDGSSDTRQIGCSPAWQVTTKLNKTWHLNTYTALDPSRLILRFSPQLALRRIKLLYNLADCNRKELGYEKRLRISTVIIAHALLLICNRVTIQSYQTVIHLIHTPVLEYVALNELLHNHLRGFLGAAYGNCVKLKALMCSTLTPALRFTSGLQHKECCLSWHET